jgi:hypothetical protein
MGLIRPSALLLALLLTAPALYRAFVTEELPVDSALLRFLIAVPAAALALAVLRFITANYGDRQPARIPLRRRADEPTDDAS